VRGEGILIDLMQNAPTKKGIKTFGYSHKLMGFKTTQTVEAWLSLPGLTSTVKSSRVRRNSTGARPQPIEVDWNHVVDITKK
jgi:hypothetical protein